MSDEKLHQLYPIEKLNNQLVYNYRELQKCQIQLDSLSDYLNNLPDLRLRSKFIKFYNQFKNTKRLLDEMIKEDTPEAIVQSYKNGEIDRAKMEDEFIEHSKIIKSMRKM
jgi:hypothetical protein